MESKLIQAIIGIEWEMFSSTHNIGGPASCQQDYNTFQIMRESQFATCPEAVLQSYLSDLTQARQDKVNLVAVKYARMMEHTDPAGYRQIKHQLPDLSGEVMELVNDIVRVFMDWNHELNELYPVLIAHGRPLSAQADYLGFTSVETYLKGELSTYSAPTLKLFQAFVVEQKNQGVNLAEEILLHTAKRYGFQTLEEAECQLAAK